MKVVFCLNHFLPYQVAGTEVYVWALAESLQRKGHQVSIVIPNYNKEFSDEYEYDGLKVYRYAEPDTVDRALITGKREPAGITSFEKLIFELKPDIVHIHELAGSNGIGIFHLRRLKRLQVKIVFTMHLARYSCFSRTMMYMGKEQCNGIIDLRKCSSCVISNLPINKVTKGILLNTSILLNSLDINTGKLNNTVGTAFSYPFIINNLRSNLLEITDLCSQIIILSEWYKKVLLGNGVPEEKIRLIKQALPASVADLGVRDELLRPTRELKLIFIGRIEPLKGLHLLIEAIERIGSDKVELHIYGSINDKSYYDYWYNRTEKQAGIKWKGLLKQMNVVNTIRQYDALVLPSTICEMSPLVVQEAFKAGVPVIGSDVAGIKEQIEDGKNGFLFKYNNSKSLELLLIELLRDDKSLLKKVKENILEPEDFQTVVDGTLDVYNKSLTN